MNRWLKWGLVSVAALVLVIQVVPYGRDHGDPPGGVPDLGSASADRLFDDACADCHSNDTEWPWYSNVAPMSWLIQDHVDEGREEWNVSEPGVDWDEGAEETLEGGMPPRSYTILHAGARLSDAEKRALADALEALDR